jgi:hypothetical protein
MHEMAKKGIVLSRPGSAAVPVRAGIEYAPGRTLDVHGSGPAVLFVSGYPDPAFEAQMGWLNASIDGFAVAALARNMPVTVANLPSAPHAHDLMDDTDASRDMIRRILAWLRFQLQVSTGQE